MVHDFVRAGEDIEVSYHEGEGSITPKKTWLIEENRTQAALFLYAPVLGCHDSLNRILDVIRRRSLSHFHVFLTDQPSLTLCISTHQLEFLAHLRSQRHGSIDPMNKDRVDLIERHDFCSILSSATPHRKVLANLVLTGEQVKTTIPCLQKGSFKRLRSIPTHYQHNRPPTRGGSRSPSTYPRPYRPPYVADWLRRSC